MTFYTNKSTGIKQQGCMLATMYLMPLLSAYWAFIMPAAVGFYWVISSVIGGVQSIVMSKHFSMQHMAAMNDAQRFVSMQLAEANVKALTATAQKQLSDQINAQQMAQAGKDEKSKKKLQQGKKKSGNKAGKSANDYMGNKK
jgi:YidC/Oxa1 family membrane protein insertase